MLIGNKKDKENREVPYNMALEYAMKNNFGLMEVSARHGLGINEAFNLLVSQIYKSVMDEMQEIDEEGAGGGVQTHGRAAESNALRRSMVRTQATSDSVILQPSRHADLPGTRKSQNSMMRSSRGSKLSGGASGTQKKQCCKDG